MADDEKKAGQSAQVYRLTKVGAGEDRKALRKLTAGGFFTVPDAPAGSVGSNALDPEDEYQTFYVGQNKDRGILEPPYVLRKLDQLSQENNTLSPCIEAMVSNIEGTGYDFKQRGVTSASTEEDAKIEELREFFREPWPGMNFVELRKLVRRDLERTGNGYVEILRNPQDEIVFMRHVDAKMMRIIKKDDPVPVKMSIMRKGKKQEITVAQRERRFCQLLNGITFVYFKEFGASRDLDKTTNTWAAPGVKLPAKQRATEILHFTCLPDSHTPYGVPRWISQLPSVLGSRKAEEFNLEFFDNGGIPPVLILLQGGTMQSETRKALEQKTQGGAKALNRVQILEVEPSGGSMDHPTTAKVTVERFGGDRMTDAMFEKYDDKCEERVRRAFRLDTIFLGDSGAHNFATAYVSYTVTEAQVFKPERDAFDEIINYKLLPAMGYEDYELISKPLIIEDVNLKLEGMQIAMATGNVDLDDLIYELNQATGLNMKVGGTPLATHTVDEKGNIVPLKSPPSSSVKETAGNQASLVAPKVPKPPTIGGQQETGDSRAKKSELGGITALALDTLMALRNRDMPGLSQNFALIKSLDSTGIQRFHKAAAELQFVNADNDFEGLGQLVACTMAVMGRADAA